MTPTHIESINSGITDCVNNWCTKHKVNKKVLLAWEKEVMSNVDKKIECLKHRTLQFKTQQVFQNYSSKKCIKELHDRFVIAPIDKATGNVAFILQKVLCFSTSE